MRQVALALTALLTFTAQAKTVTNVGISLTTIERAADYAGAKLSGLVQQPDGRLALSGSVGTVESAPIPAPAFDELIPSWNADTPAGSWLGLEVRARVGGRWTKFYSFGRWTSGEAPRRSSVNGQKDADGDLLTDTLRLSRKADAYSYRLTLNAGTGAAPSLRLLTFTTSDRAARTAGAGAASDRSAWGKVIAVPQRSQMLYKGGGEVWCSPTSASMILAYFGVNVPVPEAARATYDAAYDGNGNWPFNTAFAASRGMRAYVTRLPNFAALERYISAGVPVVISAGWKKGELNNASIPSTDGHLMVVVGFDPAGNPVMNDPAGRSDAEVRRTYDRATLERLWLTHSGGLVYVMAPPSYQLPDQKLP